LSSKDKKVVKANGRGEQNVEQEDNLGRGKRIKKPKKFLYT